MNKVSATAISSAEKALNILLAFTPVNRELGTTELSVRLGIHKSTTSRLLKLLVASDFLQQNPLTRKYSLGRAAIRIGTATIRSQDSRLLAVAQPCLAELAEATGESIALEVLSGINVKLALHVEGPSHLRFSFQQGEQVPLNVAAGAKVILAYSDQELTELCLQQDFERFNERTIMDKDAYRNLLSEVRATGLAYDHGERYLDSHAMAAPVLDLDGSPKAAVVIAGPAYRLTQEFMASAAIPLRRTAARIGTLLYT